MRKRGIIITLIGIGLFLISIFFSEGYSPRQNIISNMYSMEIVIDSGRLVDGGRLYSIPKIEPGTRPDPGSGFIVPKIEGRLSIPLKYLLSLSTIITLVGVGKILLSKKQK